METCWKCMGDGGFHDCGEDCCSCANPATQDYFICDVCDGTGDGGHGLEDEDHP